MILWDINNECDGKIKSVVHFRTLLKASKTLHDYAEASRLILFRQPAFLQTVCPRLVFVSAEVILSPTLHIQEYSNKTRHYVCSRPTKSKRTTGSHNITKPAAGNSQPTGNRKPEQKLETRVLEKRFRDSHRIYLLFSMYVHLYELKKN